MRAGNGGFLGLLSIHRISVTSLSIKTCHTVCQTPQACSNSYLAVYTCPSQYKPVPEDVLKVALLPGQPNRTPLVTFADIHCLSHIASLSDRHHANSPPSGPSRDRVLAPLPPSLPLPSSVSPSHRPHLPIPKKPKRPIRPRFFFSIHTNTKRECPSRHF